MLPIDDPSDCPKFPDFKKVFSVFMKSQKTSQDIAIFGSQSCNDHFCKMRRQCEDIIASEISADK
jgi:hypothetical protein